MFLQTVLILDRWNADDTRCIDLHIPIEGEVTVGADGTHVVVLAEPPEAWRHWPVSLHRSERDFTEAERIAAEVALIEAFEAASVPFALEAA